MACLLFCQLLLFTGDVFPEYFYSFLHGYFKQFSITMQLTPDKCIQKYIDSLSYGALWFATSPGSTEMSRLFWPTYCWTRDMKTERQAMEVVLMVQ